MPPLSLTMMAYPPASFGRKVKGRGVPERVISLDMTCSFTSMFRGCIVPPGALRHDGGVIVLDDGDDRGPSFRSRAVVGEGHEIERKIIFEVLVAVLRAYPDQERARIHGRDTRSW